MSAKNKHRSWLGYHDNAAFGESPADWEADAVLLEHTAVDVTTVAPARLDDPTLERDVMAHNKRHKIAGLRNTTGTLAMARTGDPHSATAQFFINVKDNAFLDPVPVPAGDPVPRFEYQGRVYENVPRSQIENAPQLFGYTVFGRVVSGMDVVNRIKATPTGSGGPFPTDVPRTPVIIQSATLLP